MKRVHILGVFIGALVVAGYEPAAEAMPASAPGIAAGSFESDGLVVKTQTAGQARPRTARRTYRRTSPRAYLIPYARSGYPYAPENYGRPEFGFYGCAVPGVCWGGY
jgi:hypothetical protein